MLYSLQLHHCTTARGNKRRCKISSSLGCVYVWVWKQCCDAQLSQSSPCCLSTANCIINGLNCLCTQLQWLITLQTPYGQSLQILMSLQDILYEQLTVCRTVLNHSWSNCTCPPKFPPVPQNPETPSACINLVHPGGKNPAAANVVPPSKLCPRSSTNFKVMWTPPPLSPYFACLPQLWG